MIDGKRPVLNTNQGFYTGSDLIRIRISFDCWYFDSKHQHMQVTPFYMIK